MEFLFFNSFLGGVLFLAKNYAMIGSFYSSIWGSSLLGGLGGAITGMKKMGL